MTEIQFEKIMEVLKEIESNTSQVESNTSSNGASFKAIEEKIVELIGTVEQADINITAKLPR